MWSKKRDDRDEMGDTKFPQDARTQWKQERFCRKSCSFAKGLQVRIRKNGNLSLEGGEESVSSVLNAILIHLSFQPAAGLPNEVED
jgi:hypothetical protein